jgi:ParB/RepB/Spo0J family partition protein
MRKTLIMELLSSHFSIGPVNLKDITVGERRRPLDPAKVEELSRSMAEHGQKQPIGVREKRDGGYELVFGAHRFAAAQLSHRWDILAVIYPADYPDDRVKLDELIENLHRNDLTPEQRAVHQTAYAALLKRLKKLTPADEKRSTSEKKTRSGNKKGCEEPEVRHIADPHGLPTVTEKLANDSGVTPKAVRERHKTALRLAASEGVLIDGPAGVEALDGETLDKVAAAASAAIAKQPKKPKTPAKPKKKAFTKIGAIGGIPIMAAELSPQDTEATKPASAPGRIAETIAEVKET